MIELYAQEKHVLCNIILFFYEENTFLCVSLWALQMQSINSIFYHRAFYFHILIFQKYKFGRKYSEWQDFQVQI